jgi:hypothetical protein
VPKERRDAFEEDFGRGQPPAVTQVRPSTKVEEMARKIADKYITRDGRVLKTVPLS